jgi:hypothetical protein
MAESNSAGYSTISRRIWKKWPKWRLANSIAYQPFPNKKRPGRQHPDPGVEQLHGIAAPLSCMSIPKEVLGEPAENRAYSYHRSGAPILELDRQLLIVVVAVERHNNLRLRQYRIYILMARALGRQDLQIFTFL